ncbi:ABC transporter permease subunit [Lipingzhangella sp. LS1_29]|uniref:ABC transporter permease subunit n=1 Tax=Lipingzhangella rawalii TaxID=2055835 RepID=A0ABU2HBB3_9ACTN|nr:ABC transporter permease subunit [Lipingzhangella rawalii]MDS1272571.1 ABC transporter permease subunit [Lipingzhangella rawalii]
MRLTLLRKALRDDRRAILGWTVGVAAFLLVYLPFYSEFAEDTAGAEEMLEVIPEGMRTAMGMQELFTGAGFLESMVFNLYGPLLLVVYAVVLGNRAIAVPEESGRLDQLLALPISRQRYVHERLAALTIEVVYLTAVLCAIVLAFAVGLDMGVALGNIVAISVGVGLLALLFGTLTVAVGGLSGSRGLGLTVTGAVAVGTYLVHVLSDAGAELVEPLRWASPFHYYLDADPLRDGIPLGSYAVLLGVIIILAVAATVTFERRDIGV